MMRMGKAMDAEERASWKLLRSLAARSQRVTRLKVPDPTVRLESEVSKSLAARLNRRGMQAQPEYSVPQGAGRVDIFLGRAGTSASAIVEVKMDAQAYSGIGQLYYYREAFGDRKPHMVLAVPADPAVFSEQLARACKSAKVILWAYTLHPRTEVLAGSVHDPIPAVPGSVHQ